MASPLPKCLHLTKRLVALSRLPSDHLGAVDTPTLPSVRRTASRGHLLVLVGLRALGPLRLRLLEGLEGGQRLPQRVSL